jgi:hypothetical protein
LVLESAKVVWITEDCEPVRVQFTCEGKTPEQIVSDADCRSHDLAARLIYLLRIADEDDQVRANQNILLSDFAYVWRLEIKARTGPSFVIRQDCTGHPTIGNGSCPNPF